MGLSAQPLSSLSSVSLPNNRPMLVAGCIFSTLGQIFCKIHFTSSSTTLSHTVPPLSSPGPQTWIGLGDTEQHGDPQGQPVSREAHGDE